MGKLTLCVAHELNNPLDGIRRYLSLALIKKEEPELVERYLTEAQKGLHKMSLSIKSLMFSANPFKAPPRASDKLQNLLQDAIKIMMFQASDQRVQVSFHSPRVRQDRRWKPTSTTCSSISLRTPCKPCPMEAACWWTAPLRTSRWRFPLRTPAPV